MRRFFRANFFKKVNSAIEIGFTKQLSGIGFGFFRISFFFVLLLEVWQMFTFRNVIFGNSSGLMSSLLFVWMLALLGIIFGYKTNIAKWINFVFAVFIIGSFTDFEYHIDYIYLGVSFLSLFTPLENAMAISNILKRSQPKTVPLFFYYLILFVALGSVYFESVFHKLASSSWREGLGFWLPTAHPAYVDFHFSWILNNAILSKSIGYLTLFFEGFFVFLFWRKSFRWLLFIVGVGLHIGILMVYPIPFFGIAMISFYFLLIPDCTRKKIFTNSPSIYLVDNFLNARMKFLVFFVVVMQALALANAPGVQKILSANPLTKKIVDISVAARSLRILTLGMAPHGVFTDYHFFNTFYDYRVDMVSTQNGVDDLRKDIFKPYVKGRIWANWAFRFGHYDEDADYFRMMFKRYLAFYCNEKFKIDCSSRRFLLRRRSMRVSKAVWKKDFYHEMNNLPWESKGAFVLKGGELEKAF